MKKVIALIIICSISYIMTIEQQEPMNLQERPKIGIGVCIVKEGKVLMGKRLNSHGQGHWAFPGGHLEFGESLAECARREVLEETGLHITNIRRGPDTEDIFIAEKKHYITIIMIADYASGIPQVLEPHKCERWEWFSLNALPQPLFLTFENLAKNNINLANYF
jgi:8-oxo-dGTP diphosphatase